MNKFSMISLFSILFILLSINNIYSNEQLLRYEFESGSGLICFDSSGNENNGFITNAVFSGVIKKFGDYSLNFNGETSQVIVSQGDQMPENMSISFWWRCENDGDKQNILTIYDNDRTHFNIGYDTDGEDDLTLFYQDSGLNDRYIHLDTANKCSKTDFINYIVTYSDSTKLFQLYKNGALTESVTLVNPIYFDINTKFLKLGTNRLSSTNFLTGYLDEFRIFNFILSQSQINELQINTISGLTTPSNETNENETPTIPATSQLNRVYDIINYTIPSTQGLNFTENIDISGLLNLQSSCMLYIDNNYYSGYNNILAFNEKNVNLDYGEHEYFLYCYYVHNDTLYYELTEPITFNLVQSTAIVSFYFSGTDFDINDNSLYLVTPCIKDIIDIPAITKDIVQNINKDVPYYFQKLNNGYAEFNVNDGTNEFCLINGNVQYSHDYLTTDYNINAVEGVLNLGKFNTPSNVTSSYSISVDKFEIYDKINPKAWGETWPSLISGLVLLIIGALVVVAGVMSVNGKIVIAGALLCLGALGISFSGVFGVLA